MYANLRNELSVVDYLESKGFKFHRRGNKFFTNSPFSSSDNTPSFCVFPDGAWKDFSSGKAGNIITLVKFFKDNPSGLTIEKKWVAPKPIAKKPWNGINHKFTDITPDERKQVMDYAKSRGFIDGYLPGCWYEKTNDGFKKHLAILFPHENNGTITGAKFRSLPGDTQRFSSSGELGFYKLECSGIGEPVCYIVEGEGNANSLYRYCLDMKISALILSAGSVTSIPKEIITSYRKKLLIDYDGNEDRYKDRISRYSHLGAEPIRLILPKGEDINSLYCSNKMYLIDSML